jgi:hypothetical protein
MNFGVVCFLLVFSFLLFYHHRTLADIVGAFTPILGGFVHRVWLCTEKEHPSFAKLLLPPLPLLPPHQPALAAHDRRT